MSKITLYTIPLSPPGRAVQLTAKALGLDVEIKIVNLIAGDHLTPEFLKLNPQHTIPTLVDGDTVLWDSHAIIIYLVSKYGKKNDPLYPDDLVTRAKIQQHLHFDSGVLFSRLRFLFEPILYYGSPDVPQDKVDYIYKAFDLLEAVLQNSPYLVGSNLTLADLSCITSVTSVNKIFPLSEEKYPKINAWIKRLGTLPYYQEINQAGADVLQQLYKDKLAENQRK